MKFHVGGEGGVVAEQFSHGTIEAWPRWQRRLCASLERSEADHGRRKNNQMLFHISDGIILFAVCQGSDYSFVLPDAFAFAHLAFAIAATRSITSRSVSMVFAKSILPNSSFS